MNEIVKNAQANADIIEDTPEAPLYYFDDRNVDYISNLPPDILYEIIKYFTPQEISVRIATLSHKFYNFSQNPLLWRNLNFEPFPKFSLNQIKRIMMKSLNPNYAKFRVDDYYQTGVQSLNFSGRETLDENELLELAPYLHMLTYLNISFCYGVNESFIEVLQQICPNLKILIAKGCTMMTEPAFCLLSNLCNLHTLNLNHTIEMTDLALATIGSGLSNLEVITLKGIINFFDNGIKLFINERGQALVKFEIDGTYMTDEAVLEISRNCQKIEILLIHSACRLTDISLQSVKEMKTLKSLKMARCKKFTEPGFLDFFETGKLSDLQAIDFSECKSFTNNIVEKMCYKHNVKLERLSLSFCWTIDDDGFLPILQNLQNLEILEMAGLNRLTWAHIPLVPEKLPKLHYFDLRQCNQWIDDDVDKIVEKMHHLMVINFLGYEVYHKPGIGLIHSPRRICE